MKKELKNTQFKKDLDLFQKNIQYSFHNIDTLVTALTHSSYANENRYAHIMNNERLEFLGDAVLETIISEYLFNQYPQLPEGELTRIRASIVCESSLAQCSQKLKVGNYLLLGKGEDMTGGRERISILSDAFEALLGAIFIDGGLEVAKKWAIEQIYPIIEAAIKGNAFIDCKTLLQESIQKHGDKKIEYELIAEKGPDHNKKFFVQVKHNNRIIGNGTGKSKKEAEQNAAKEALKLLKR